MLYALGLVLARTTREVTKEWYIEQCILKQQISFDVVHKTHKYALKSDLIALFHFLLVASLNIPG